MSPDALHGPRDHRWWTGPAPDSAPRDEAGGLIVQQHPAGLAAYFDNGWLLGETLFAALQGEDAFYRRPWHGLRHPLIFYYGHTAVFYVNKLRLAGVIADGIDAHFERLFEMGVDEMAWDDLSQARDDWPRVAEVTAYRRRVHALVHEQIAALPADGPIRGAAPLRALLMGCEHERIHLETSAMLVRELPAALLRRPENFPALCTARGVAASDPLWVEVPGASVRLGREDDGNRFGWDCEFGTREVTVPDLQVARELVSNAAFAAFVDDGGYREPRFWSAEGWRWREGSGAVQPLFWSTSGTQRLLRTQFEHVPLPGDWPAEVNYFEAEAFAAWRAQATAEPCRLPREAEQARLECDAPDAAADSVAMRAAGHNLALAWGSPQPVTRAAPNAHGIRDARGNLWSWCAEHYRGLPGQPEDPLYPAFSRPAAGDSHRVLRGGSFLSSGNYAGRGFRNFFRPHFHQHAGIRLVATA